MSEPPRRPTLHPSVPTAMHDDGTLDDDGQAALAATLAAAGALGLIAVELVGGEAGSLDEDERAAVLRATRRGAGGLPVALGVGPPDPGMVVRAHRAAAGGADALVVAVPAAAMRRTELLEEVAGVGLPVWLHHRPTAGDAPLGSEQLAQLASQLDAAAVIVEATPSPDHLAGVLAAGRSAYGGLAGLFLLEELEVGASGTIAGSAVPELLGAVVASFPDTPGEATERFTELLLYLRLEAGSAGLRVRKEGWRQRGVLASSRTRDGAPLGAVTKRSITRRLRQVGTDLRDPYPGA